MVNSTLEEKLERSLCSLKFMEYCFRLFVQWSNLYKWISFLLLLKLNITNFVASKNTNLLSHISESQKSETSFMGQKSSLIRLVFLLEVSREKLLAGLFQLLEIIRIPQLTAPLSSSVCTSAASASLLTSSLTLTCLLPSFMDPCDYFGPTGLPG